MTCLDFFAYPGQALARKHGPEGYTDYSSYKPWLRDELTFRCVFCLIRERWYQDEDKTFHVDHWLPKGNPSYEDLATDYDNLLYMCGRCNTVKGTTLDLIDPQDEALDAHLVVRESGRIDALTTAGEILSEALNLNEEPRVDFRGRMIRAINRLEPEDEDRLGWLGFPLQLPNLPALRPPSGNTRPDGVKDCYHVQREEGRLPATY